MNDHAEKLRSTIAEMIRKLENEEYRLLLEEHSDPDAVANAKSEGRFDRVVASANSHGDRISEILKTVQQEEPTFNKEGNEATFQGPEVPSRPVKFKWIDEKWYMMNS